jgi:hypothetical protein
MWESTGADDQCTLAETALKESSPEVQKGGIEVNKVHGEFAICVSFSLPPSFFRPVFSTLVTKSLFLMNETYSGLLKIEMY